MHTYIIYIEHISLFRPSKHFCRIGIRYIYSIYGMAAQRNTKVLRIIRAEHTPHTHTQRGKAYTASHRTALDLCLYIRLYCGWLLYARYIRSRTVCARFMLSRKICAPTSKLSILSQSYIQSACFLVIFADVRLYLEKRREHAIYKMFSSVSRRR